MLSSFPIEYTDHILTPDLAEDAHSLTLYSVGCLGHLRITSDGQVEVDCNILDVGN